MNKKTVAKEKKYHDRFFLSLKIFGVVVAATLVCSTVVLGVSGLTANLPQLNYNVGIEDGRGGLMVSTTEVALALRSVSDNASSSFGLYAAALANYSIGSSMPNATGVFGVGRRGSGTGNIDGSGDAIGVHGKAITNTNDAKAIGVLGEFNRSDGSVTPGKAFGVMGMANGSVANGNYFGVYGLYRGSFGSGFGYGVYGESLEGSNVSAGVYGKNDNSNAYAGYFEGNVGVTGDLRMSLTHATTTGCSLLGSLYFNEQAKELCYCDGTTWRKTSATSTTCN